MQLCNQEQIDSIFQGVEQSSHTIQADGQFYCFEKPEEIEFLGFTNSEERQYLEISIDFGCDGQGYFCGCTELVSEIYKDQTFDLRWLTKQRKYSPQELGNKTLKPYIESKQYHLTQFEGQLDFDLMQHKIESKETWLDFGILQPKEKTFYSLDMSPKLTDMRQKGQLLKINIGLNPDRQIWSRQVYDFLTWVKDFGGLYKGLQLFGFVLMWLRNQIVGDVFNHVLAKRLFKTDIEDWKLLSNDELG